MEERPDLKFIILRMHFIQSCWISIIGRSSKSLLAGWLDHSSHRILLKLKVMSFISSELGQSLLML